MEIIGRGSSISRSSGTILQIGFFAAVVSFVGAFGYDVSVVLLISNVVVGLENSIIAFSFSLIIATPFLISMLVLQYTVSVEDKKFWANTAIALGVIYTTFVTMNYVVQLTTVIPALYQGTLGSLALTGESKHFNPKSSHSSVC